MAFDPPGAHPRGNCRWARSAAMGRGDLGCGGCCAALRHTSGAHAAGRKRETRPHGGGVLCGAHSRMGMWGRLVSACGRPALSFILLALGRGRAAGFADAAYRRARGGAPRVRTCALRSRRGPRPAGHARASPRASDTEPGSCARFPESLPSCAGCWPCNPGSKLVLSRGLSTSG